MVAKLVEHGCVLNTAFPEHSAAGPDRKENYYSLDGKLDHRSRRSRMGLRTPRSNRT